MNLDKWIQTLYNLMGEMWQENTRHRESIRILKTQLQDANRKLAAMGMEHTASLFKRKYMDKCFRSLTQQDWDLLEEEEAKIHKDWQDTQQDALDVGVQ